MSDEKQLLALFAEEPGSIEITSGLTQDFQNNKMSFSYKCSEGEFTAVISITEGKSEPALELMRNSTLPGHFPLWMVNGPAKDKA